MDLLTQGVLGASVGYVASGKIIGRRKSLLWGAFWGFFPDSDLLIPESSFMGEFIFHRGLTHSLFFAPFMALIVSGFLKLKFKKDFKSWYNIIFWALLTHPLLDVFTPGDTQLLFPFLNHGFSFSAISGVDLGYSAPLGIAVLFLWFNKDEVFPKIFNLITLFLTTTYLFLGVMQHDIACKRVNAEACMKKWCGTYSIRPAYFNIFKRYVEFLENGVTHRAEISTLNDNTIVWEPN